MSNRNGLPFQVRKEDEGVIISERRRYKSEILEHLAVAQVFRNSLLYMNREVRTVPEIEDDEFDSPYTREMIDAYEGKIR